MSTLQSPHFNEATISGLWLLARGFEDTAGAWLLFEFLSPESPLATYLSYPDQYPIETQSMPPSIGPSQRAITTKKKKLQLESSWSANYENQVQSGIIN